MMFIKYPAFIFLLFISTQAVSQHAFNIVPLGTEGGLNEANLSSYLVALYGSDKYICLDAGTLYAGVQKATANKCIHKPPVRFIRQNIKAYLISHPHLDHVAGLIINSPADTAKNVYGTKFTLNRISDHYFSWQTWANFSNEGEKPRLNKYHFVNLDEEKELAIEGTEMYVTAFRLSHSDPYESTAFLVRKDSSYLLYFGDTGADSIEHSQRLYNVWQHIAPLINKRQLKGIFLECSYPDEQPYKLLFGHLTPKFLYSEMENLASVCGKKNALLNIPLIVTHIKPEGNNESRIKHKLIKSNKLRLRIIFPEQGKPINL